MIQSLSQFFNIYKFPSGRRKLAFRKVKDHVAALKALALADEADRTEEIAILGALEVRLDAAIEHDTKTRLTERAWAGRKNRRAVNAAQSIDREIDRILSAISGTLSDRIKALAEFMPDKAQEARDFQQELFPAGLQDHVQQPHDEQLEDNDAVIAILTAAHNLSAVASFGLQDFTEALIEANGRFTLALKTDPLVTVAYNDVLLANVTGQEHLLQILARILGHFSDQDAHSAATRSRLLGPIIEQQEKIAEFKRRQRAVLDVDPDTGKEIEEGDDLGPDDADPNAAQPPSNA